MAASFTIAARNNGFAKADARAATLASVTAYREAMAEFAADAHDGHLVRPLVGARPHAARSSTASASPSKRTGKKKASEEAAQKGAEKTRARRRARATACRRCRSSPSTSTASTGSSASRRSSSRCATWPPTRRRVRRRDRAARSTSSSAPTARRCRTIAATCSSDSRSSTSPARSSASAASAPARSSSCSRAATQDPLFLQVKEATASVLEDHLPKSRYDQPGERVVQGQRLMQAASDIFLGWTKGVRGEPLPLLAPAARHEGLGRRRGDGAGRPRRSTPHSAARRWPGPTPDPATRSRSPRTSARRTGSTSRSPTSPSATPTRTSGTTRRSRRRSDRAGCRCSRVVVAR